MKLQSTHPEQEIPNSRKSRPQSKKILVIRSASRTYPRALAALKQEFPGARFYILTENSEITSEGDDIQAIIPLPPGKRISLFSFGVGKRLNLRRIKFDLAVMLYNVPGGTGYSNVETLAWSSGAREIRGYFPDGSFQPLSGFSILKNTLKEQASFGWVVLNIITAFILLMICTALMGGEALVRLFNRKSSARPRPSTSSQS